ncbi:hypothetical protein RRG08_050022 [Elysia crispata]|uniref:Uncharacterized protein n=1 Tax=Elysia crispata TaxID=231223 RepID=A0AAE1BAW8_9GAST|nr:hypothetical protein RRG08_050022 [Elysia crispata]
MWTTIHELFALGLLRRTVVELFWFSQQFTFSFILSFTSSKFYANTLPVSSGEGYNIKHKSIQMPRFRPFVCFRLLSMAQTTRLVWGRLCFTVAELIGSPQQTILGFDPV